MKGVLGHFTEHEGSDLPPFLHVDDVAAKLMAPLVGAEASEVAVMETLTANLHLLMASFYRPNKEKYKIIIEGKAFPSDHVRNVGGTFEALPTLSNLVTVCCRIPDPTSQLRPKASHGTHRTRKSYSGHDIHIPYSFGH